MKAASASGPLPESARAERDGTDKSCSQAGIREMEAEREAIPQENLRGSCESDQYDVDLGLCVTSI
jgi:hypothetical protein